MSLTVRKLSLVGMSLLALGIPLLLWLSTPYYLEAATEGTRAALIVEERDSNGVTRATAIAIEVTDPQSCAEGSGVARVLGIWDASAARFEPGAREIPCSSLRVLPADALATTLQRAGRVASSDISVPPRRPFEADPSYASFSLGVALNLHVRYSDSIIQTRLDTSGNRQVTESVCAYRVEGGVSRVMYFLDRKYAFERWPDF